MLAYHEFKLNSLNHRLQKAVLIFQDNDQIIKLVFKLLCYLRLKYFKELITRFICIKEYFFKFVILSFSLTFLYYPCSQELFFCYFEMIVALLMVN